MVYGEPLCLGCLGSVAGILPPEDLVEAAKTLSTPSEEKRVLFTGRRECGCEFGK